MLDKSVCIVEYMHLSFIITNDLQVKVAAGIIALHTLALSLSDSGRYVLKRGKRYRKEIQTQMSKIM